MSWRAWLIIFIFLAIIALAEAVSLSHVFG